MMQRVCGMRVWRWSGLLLATVTVTSLLSALPGLAASSSELPEVVATVQGQPISAEELTNAVRGELLRLDQQRYQLLKDKLDDVVADKIFALEAAKRGQELPQFIQEEITAKVPAVSLEQAKAFYESNKSRIKKSFEEVSAHITTYLQQQEQEKRRQALFNELRPQYTVRVALRSPKVDVPTAGNPSLGPDNAPVTIVEFSDYQCPYCRQVQASLKRLLKEYEGKVRLVFRDFPLRNIHPQAQKAAEAAQCAGEQQQFWPYHDRLFAVTSLQNEDLKKYAQELSLNVEQFTTCLDSNKQAGGIDEDMRAGQQAGVSATPSFFVNGFLVSGAASYERLKEVVDNELEQSGQAVSKN
ncbi:MAG: thioredoxin domain-containing protein [Candidatus Tectimicrobiota bacterium]